jgi:predicted ATP-dependent serine protease
LSDEITAPELEVNKKYDLPAIVNNNTEVVTIQQMKKNKIKPMQLPSKYNSLLGKVPNNFRMLLWGAPGHGKSSLALTIGNDIARRCKVLFVSAEESVQSATLQNRIKRFKANSRNLMFNDTTNPAIIESIIAKLNPKFIIIDSVNVIEGKVEAIINLMMKYPEIGFIVIAQATKDHKRYSGLGSLAHAVDIVVNVKSGIAQAEKNRFASLGSMPVKGITI